MIFIGFLMDFSWFFNGFSMVFKGFSIDVQWVFKGFSINFQRSSIYFQCLAYSEKGGKMMPEWL